MGKWDDCTWDRWSSYFISNHTEWVACSASATSPSDKYKTKQNDVKQVDCHELWNNGLQCRTMSRGCHRPTVWVWDTSSEKKCYFNWSTRHVVSKLRQWAEQSISWMNERWVNGRCVLYGLHWDWTSLVKRLTLNMDFRVPLLLFISRKQVRPSCCYSGHDST